MGEQSMTIMLNGSDLTVTEVVTAARHGEPVALAYPPPAGLRLVRRGPQPSGPCPGRPGGKIGRLSGGKNTNWPNGAWYQPRGRACHPGRRGRGVRHHRRPEPVVADAGRHLTRTRPA